MARTRRYLAVDLGASSGRVVLGEWDGSRFALSEIHRFPNGPVRIQDGLYSDVLGLWREINEGIARASRTCGGQLDGVGLDTWGVDFALLDKDGALVGNPRHYRDRRTDDILEHAFERVPRDEIFEATGLQVWQINTLFQLYSMVRTGSAELEAARTLLPLPNLFYYWLGAPALRRIHRGKLDPVPQPPDAGLVDGLDRPIRHPHGAVPVAGRAGDSRSARCGAELASDAGLSGATRVVAVGSHDTASAVGAIPGLDEKSAFISSGTWSVMGMEMPRPVVNVARPGDRLHQRGRPRGQDPPAQEPDRAVAPSGVSPPLETRRTRLRLGGASRARRHGGAFPIAHRSRSPRLPEPGRHAGGDPSLLPPDGAAGALRASGRLVRCCLESLALRYRMTLRRAGGAGRQPGRRRSGSSAVAARTGCSASWRPTRAECR